MIHLDTALVDIVERCCRRIQVLTGRTNVWLAVQLTNISIVVYFAWAAVSFWIVGGVGLRVFIALFCAALIVALAQTVLKVPIETYESIAYRRVAKGMRNPRRVRDAPLRISFLTLSVALAAPIAFVYATLRLRFFLLTYLLIALTTLLLYLLACDPLPPCAGRIWEWLRQAVPRLRTSESDANACSAVSD